MMATLQFPDGIAVPLIGQGTWKMGEGERKRADEVAALREGIELGLAMIDTAEMYGEGAAEEVVADLLPWCARRGIPVIAYSPVGQGGALLRNPVLVEIARRHSVTPAQVALAWALRHPGVVVIPKASDVAHVRANAAALKVCLAPEDGEAIDRAFPPPAGKRPLTML